MLPADQKNGKDRKAGKVNLAKSGKPLSWKVFNMLPSWEVFLLSKTLSLVKFLLKSLLSLITIKLIGKNFHKAVIQFLVARLGTSSFSIGTVNHYYPSKIELWMLLVAFHHYHSVFKESNYQWPIRPIALKLKTLKYTPWYCIHSASKNHETSCDPNPLWKTDIEVINQGEFNSTSILPWYIKLTLRAINGRCHSFFSFIMKYSSRLVLSGIGFQLFWYGLLSPLCRTDWAVYVTVFCKKLS